MNEGRDIVSSAERFVRHHRRQTDRAISQAYARLATDALATATFHELLRCARNRAVRLLNGPVVNGHLLVSKRWSICPVSCGHTSGRWSTGQARRLPGDGRSLRLQGI